MVSAFLESVYNKWVFVSGGILSEWDERFNFYFFEYSAES